VRRRTDGEQRKTLAKERVPGISDLDVSPFLLFWVLEGGTQLIDRLIASITAPYWLSFRHFPSCDESSKAGLKPG